MGHLFEGCSGLGKLWTAIQTCRIFYGCRIQIRGPLRDTKMCFDKKEFIPVFLYDFNVDKIT